MPSQKLKPLTRALCIVAGICAVVAAWHLAFSLGWVSKLLLPPPSDVAQSLARMARTASFWHDVGSTLTTWLAGVIVGTVVGGALGFVLALNPYIWAAAEPWVEFLRSLPSVVLVPLVSIFLGVGANSRFTCAALVVAALMMASAATAIRATRSSHLRLAIAWRATFLRTLASFYFPATLSHLAVALRAAIPLALIVTVAADMLIATDAGLGRILMDALAVFDTKKLYAGVIVVGALGYLAAGLSAVLERKTIHWSAA
jgi:NitT/TauT family transport system permease protein